MSAVEIAPVPRVAVTLTEAAESLGVSLSTLRRHVLPQIKGIKVGNCSLIAVTELSQWASEHGILGVTSEL